MISFTLFPRLTATNHRVTSPSTTLYNCIAWAADDTKNWWQPGLHWPFPTHPLDDTIAELRKVFESLGYEECPSSDWQPGLEKVALYGVLEIYTHVARQLSDGKWTSKLGNEEDIEHDAPESVAGGIYGEVVLFMKRAQLDSI
jgi:hypothetical protein